MDHQPQPQPQRRRRAWVLPAVLGALLLAGGITAAAVLAGPVTDRGNAVSLSNSDSLDALFEPAAASSEDENAAKDKPLRQRLRGHHPLRLADGEKVVVGSVGSVSDGTLVVRKDDGAEVTVPTNGDTKVAGAQNKALTDLQSGERVIVKVGADGTADGVLAVKAHAAGTVTKLDGDRATVVRPGGLTTVLDLSGVSERPAAGSVVIAVGTPADDGATLKVEQLRELPTVN